MDGSPTAMGGSRRSDSGVRGRRGILLPLLLMSGCALAGPGTPPALTGGAAPSPPATTPGTPLGGDASGPGVAGADRSGEAAEAWAVGWSEEGIASWYGVPFHGRQTASGAVYDMEGPTAAHQTLPFGTRLRVRNLDNGAVTELEVTDRGPFVGGRILDLSRAKARELGILGPGTARVRIEIVEIPPPPPDCAELQFGAYRSVERAHALADRIAREGIAVRTEPGPGGTTRVIGGPFTRAEAERALSLHGGRVMACPATPGGTDHDRGP